MRNPPNCNCTYFVNVIDFNNIALLGIKFPMLGHGHTHTHTHTYTHTHTHTHTHTDENQSFLSKSPLSLLFANFIRHSQARDSPSINRDVYCTAVFWP